MKEEVKEEVKEEAAAGPGSSPASARKTPEPVVAAPSRGRSTRKQSVVEESSDEDSSPAPSPAPVAKVPNIVQLTVASRKRRKFL